MVALPGHASIEPRPEVILAASAQVLGEEATHWHALQTASGIDNHLYLLGDDSRRLLFRFSAARRAEDIHRKEMAATQAAQAAGVSTIPYFHQGVIAEFSFIVRNYIEGDSPIKPQHAPAAWRALGEALALLEKINCLGYGWNDVYAPSQGNKVHSYREWLLAQCEELLSDTLLEQYSVLTTAAKQRVLCELEAIAEQDCEVALCHGNFSLNNMVRDHEGAFLLIDWGNCFAGPQPAFDLAEVAAWHEADQWLRPLAEGYGCSPQELAATLRTTVPLQLWRILWAIRRDIARLGEGWQKAPYARRCLEVLPRLLHQL